jgi:NAD(P) transhydrogenase subunit beta
MEVHGTAPSQGIPEDVFALVYLISAVFFIWGLKGLSHPSTARRGNLFGMIGMALAIITTLLRPEMDSANLPLILGGLAVGAAIGIPLAVKVAMTSMPELVAALHSFVGMAAVLVGVGTFILHRAIGHPMTGVARSEIFIGVFIGAITFTGSVIAFGKLSGKMRSAPTIFKGQHILNLLIFVAMFALGIAFAITQGLPWLIAMTILAFILGVTLIIPIGGADMPVVVSMLNSYSGWAAAAAGFILSNNLLIVTGALVGSSGAILSYIMCKAMNRSIINVMLGGFGTGDDAGAIAATNGKAHRSAAVEDVVYMLGNASEVIIIPGYGMAVAQAQHAVRELTDLLTEKGIDVKFAIHPVAGRMPGHMNVLLAEADISYDKVFELEDINSEFPSADVALVIGANDIVNPAAEHDKASPIYGMPILTCYKTPLVYVVKRSMNVGYAGIDNELYYEDNCNMVFGDAKKVCEQIVASMKS